MRGMTMSLFCCGLILGTMAAGGETSPAPSGQMILDEGSPWRMFASWNTPVIRKDTGVSEDGGVGGMFVTRTAPPPADWAQPDFFDGPWSRWSWGRTRSKVYDYGFAPAGGAPGPTLSLLCVRGKFAVEDPAKVQKLTLSLAYRGGAVVYVNGQEVARANLPKEGKIEPGTLAEDYPAEVFVHDGPPQRGSNCIVAEFGHPVTYKNQLEKRIRSIENVTIDPKLLRKGTNVLAVEIHRAPYFGNGLAMEGMNHESVWSTAGLVNLALRAEGGAAPNLSRPAGIQVVAWPETRRPSLYDYGSALDKADPVSIVGCQNGAFNGRVMVFSDKAFSGVKAQVSDLKQAEAPSIPSISPGLAGAGQGKGVIPASAIKLFYTIRDDKLAMRYPFASDGFWDSFADQPPAKADVVGGSGAAQSIVLKVHVPGDAEPGEYSGKITVSADGLASTDVPVKLKVIGWKLPDPKAFATHMGIIQSPDSVALQYKVPLWSEEHWKLIEESFKLLGELGNKYVVVPIIARTNFGNEQGMIRWIKDGDGYKYDFTIFDRYLDLAQKYEAVDVVCLYAWEKYAGGVGFGADANKEMPGGIGLKVTLYDPGTGKVEDLEGPKVSAAEEFQKFWAPVYKEIEARMAKRGLADATMMGMNSELARIPPGHAAAFHQLLPKAKWVTNAHADCRGSAFPCGMRVGYNIQYYMNMCPPPDSGKRYYGWQSKVGYYGRSRGPTAPLSMWRVSVEAALVHDDAGLGRVGADFWPVMGRDNIRPGKKHSLGLSGRYPESCWDQLNLDRATEATFAPGPSGAARTERSEQIRQGIQEGEARIFIEKAILAKKLDPELAKKCQEMLDQRTYHLRHLGACGGAGGAALGGYMINVWYEGAGSAGMAEKLFSAAAEVAGKTK
jgi:hypothetical protein